MHLKINGKFEYFAYGVNLATARRLGAKVHRLDAKWSDDVKRIRKELRASDAAEDVRLCDSGKRNSLKYCYCARGHKKNKYDVFNTIAGKYVKFATGFSKTGAQQLSAEVSRLKREHSSNASICHELKNFAAARGIRLTRPRAKATNYNLNTNGKYRIRKQICGVQVQFAEVKSKKEAHRLGVALRRLSKQYPDDVKRISEAMNKLNKK